MRRSSRHLAALVERLLQVFRAKGGPLPVGLQEIELEPLVTELGPQRPDDSIELDGIAADARVFADGFQLVQVVTNLLDNALRRGGRRSRSPCASTTAMSSCR